MFVGRFLMIIPMLAHRRIARGEEEVPATAGTFPVTAPVFTGAPRRRDRHRGRLTFFPAFALGPLVEHCLMDAGRLF